MFRENQNGDQLLKRPFFKERTGINSSYRDWLDNRFSYVSIMEIPPSESGSKTTLYGLTTTIGSFPSDMSGHSPATCRWGILAGETSSGIQSPAIIPGEDVGPTHFSVKEVGPRWHIFPDDMSLENLRVKAK
ncbi:hypothetical protein Tco_0093972 [Tanacetum coccineum]